MPPRPAAIAALPGFLGHFAASCRLGAFCLLGCFWGLGDFTPAPPPPRRACG